MKEKLVLFEYLQELIEKLEKNFHKRIGNYTQLAEDIPLSRKDKEKLVELLEEFYPPIKRNINDIIRRKNRGTLGIIPGMQFINRKDSRLASNRKKKKGFYDNDDMLMKKDDKFLDHMSLKIAGILHMKKEYHTHGGNSKYEDQFQTLNYTEMVIENYKDGDYTDTFGEEVAQISNIPPNIEGDVDVKFSFGVSSIHIKNINTNKFLFFHSIINFATYSSLRTLTLTNTPISEELMQLLFEYIKNFSPNLEKIELNKIHLTQNLVDVICGILEKCNVKHVAIRMCGVKSKQFGELCLSILEGRSVESVDFSQNLIGKSTENFQK